MINAEQLFSKNAESLEGVSPDELIDLVEPKVEYAMSLDGLKNRLEDGDILKVKLGIDPTGPDVHIGHIVPIRLLDIFSRANHDIDLIFGDFTAKIGDPSGRDDARKVLSDEDIAKNVTTYKAQVHHFFDTERDNVKIHRNSTWLGKMALADVFSYLQMVNLTEATQRKDFRARMEHGSTVTLAEAMYGTLQGIDSVALGSDVELGGIDQLLNVQQARTVQRNQGQRSEEILLTPIIEGTAGDGRKMSKSYNNYIAATAEPNDIYGKIMSIPDTLVIPYLAAFAPLGSKELESQSKANPFELKKQLATYLAATSAGDFETGMLAREKFEARFRDKKISEEDKVMIAVANDTSVLDALMQSGDFKSKNELRRLARDGGIRVDGQKIDDQAILEPVTPETTITVGKRRAYKMDRQNIE